MVLWHPFGTPWAFPECFFNIILQFLGHSLGIAWALLGHPLGISPPSPYTLSLSLSLSPSLFPYGLMREVVGTSVFLITTLLCETATYCKCLGSNGCERHKKGVNKKNMYSMQAKQQLTSKQSMCNRCTACTPNNIQQQILEKTLCVL